jgi:beta-ureidopropionase / N-carbamoyl-L-amino-acid hydrolase
VIDAASLERRLAGLEGIGVTDEGVHRLAWTPQDAACRAWFEAQAAATGLRAERDPAGNLWACPSSPAPWWGVGSHLDSVRGGGRFDGPLGVACGFEIAAASREPVAVVSFADEEGARFNTPTFGSKAMTGRLDLPALLARRDEHGTGLGEAMRAAGVDPDRLTEATAGLSRLRAFIEVHIDQSTAVQRAGVPVAVVSALAGRVRLEATLRGQADHAGTTPRAERRDALSAAARLIVAADELGLESAGVTVTTARIHVEPNAATTIAALVVLWIDGRAGEPGALEAWMAGLRDAAEALAQRTGVQIEINVASRSDGQPFDAGLRAALGRAAQQLVGAQVPEHVCFAGHDAGVLAARLPAAMLLVRNPSGVSHSPAEDVSLADAALAADVALVAIEGR